MEHVSGFPKDGMGICQELLFQVFGRYLFSVSMSIVLGSGELL